MTDQPIQPPVQPESNEGTLEPTVDQTHFSSVEPLMEKMSLPINGKPVIVESKPKKPWVKWAAIGGVIAMVLIILLSVFMPRRKPAIQEAKASPSPTPTVELSEKERRIQELKEDLQAADPSKMDLTFPPVQMDISVTARRR